MKSEIDQLMEQAGLDALLVVGPVKRNPNLAYFTGPVHVTSGYLLKQRSQPPVLFHRRMEREEAVRSGLATRLLADFRPAPADRADPIEAEATLVGRILDEYGVTGRVALYGQVELGPAYGAYHQLQHQRNELELVGEPSSTSVLARARATKDLPEIEQIQQIGKITTTVVGNVADYLTSHVAQDGVLVNSQGETLTVGAVKRRINLWLAMNGAENPMGSIFAVGHDAGVPHSVGRDDQPVPVGTTIVFDIFPCQVGGGYFFDLTRTWCLGFAPDQVQAVYSDVRRTHDTMFAELSTGGSCREYQIRTCELFEAAGHPTVLSAPATTDGYVHGLGHGVGLAIHEAPAFSHLETNLDRLMPGTVFSFEPGLYYPERGMGIRLEDTLWANPDGGIETLADYPPDLVLKVEGV